MYERAAPLGGPLSHLGGENLGQYLTRKDVKRRRLDRTVHLTGYDSIYGNALFVAAFRATNGGLLPDRAAYEPLTETKWAIDGIWDEVDGAVPIKWAPNEESCLIPFGPVLASHDRLSVAHGTIRKFPFAVEGGRLVLDLGEDELDDSVPRVQRMAARARWERMTEAERAKVIARAVRRRLRVLAAKRGKKK